MSHSPQTSKFKYFGPKEMKEKLRDFIKQIGGLRYHFWDFSLKLL